MLNLFTSIVITIIFVVLFIKIDDEFWGTGAFVSAIFSAVWFIACVCMIFGSRNSWLSEQSKIKYAETRKALMYCMQTNPDSVRTLASDIADYNTEILKGRRRNASPWFDWETYDFWDELELIEMPEEPLQ